jgi:hypothetical protein
MYMFTTNQSFSFPLMYATKMEKGKNNIKRRA